jgi:hypothetical protein
MERCSEHQEVFSDLQVIKTTVSNLDKTITAAMKGVEKHITDGSKWRLAIVCALVGVAGVFINSSIRFGINEAKTVRAERDIELMRSQVHELNYIRGREEGLVEGRNGKMPQVR